MGGRELHDSSSQMSRHFGEARCSGQDQEERMVGGDCDGGAVEEPTCLVLLKQLVKIADDLYLKFV